MIDPRRRLEPHPTFPGVPVRLSRGDKAYLGFADLADFMETDLHTDADIVSVFQECKRAHLLNVIRADGPIRPG